MKILIKSFIIGLGLWVAPTICGLTVSKSLTKLPTAIGWDAFGYGIIVVIAGSSGVLLITLTGWLTGLATDKEFPLTRGDQ